MRDIFNDAIYAINMHCIVGQENRNILFYSILFYSMMNICLHQELLLDKIPILQEKGARSEYVSTKNW